MIAHVTALESITPAGVTSEMRHAAKTRKGAWEVTTYDWDYVAPDATCFQRFVGKHVASICAGKGSRVLQKTTVRFTEAEIPRILHIFMHGTRNKTKLESIHSQLEQTAQTLWPTGSLEHVAMRFLAVPVLVRVFAGHKVLRPALVQHDNCWNCCVGCITCEVKEQYLRTQLKRTEESSCGASNHSDGDGDTAILAKKSKEADDSKPSSTKEGEQAPPPGEGDKPDDAQKPVVSTLRRTDSSFVCPVLGLPEQKPVASTLRRTDSSFVCPLLGLPKHGGNTAEDADIIANEHERIVDNNGIKMIVGQDYRGNDGDTKQIVGVMTAPAPKKPNVYNNSSDNARAAKEERLDKKAKPYTGNGTDRKKIARIVGDACGTKRNRAIFSVKRIERWAEENLHLEDIKSGKWSLKRLEDSLANLLQKAYPTMELKCSVKLEDMPEGKAPRLLIADGDDGQLMALIVVKCFEDLLFDWFESKSIKHAGKRAAVKRVVESLTKKGAKLVEGDGSAWDTTCNATIRGQVENPVLKHIMQVLIPYGVVPQQWHEEHLKCCEKKELKLFFQKKMDKMRMKIDAIRRSGHRGTSCLNWWMNFVNWTCSIFKEPERFLDPSVRKGIDETGKVRWWNGSFEGDDSLCALYPPMKPGDSMDQYFLGWWNRQGFNMTIVYADDRATFCGYHIACVDGEPTGFSCPELPRALKNAGVSCSSTIIQAAKDGNHGVVRDIAAAGAIARAADFAGLFPTVSRKFYDYAKEIKRSHEVADREMSMRVYGEEGHHFTEIEEYIELQNLAVTPMEELQNLQAVRCPATPEELDTFVLYPWRFENVDNFDEMLTSLPASWGNPLDKKPS